MLRGEGGVWEEGTDGAVCVFGFFGISAILVESERRIVSNRKE
jgi:hypothetical protein